MSSTEQLQAMTDFLWDFLTDEPPSLEEQQEQITQRVVDALEEAGFRGISNEELVGALDEVGSRLTAEQQAGLEQLSGEMNLNLVASSLDLSTSLTQDFEAGLEGLRIEQIEPLKTAIANQPTPVVHRHITNVTNIDDRQVVNTNNVVEKGGTLDQRIVQGDDGAVVTGGDINDSAVNTGDFEGAQAGGDLDVADSVVGGDNTAVQDSDVDALAIGGDATSIDTAPEPVIEESVIDEPALDAPVLDEGPIEEAIDSGAAAEAEAAALEEQLDV